MNLVNYIIIAIGLEYFLLACYQQFIRAPWIRRATRFFIILFAGIVLVLVVCKYSEDVKSPLISTTFIAGITAVFPLFSVQTKNIRDETKWRQDLKSWVTGRSIGGEKNAKQLLRLLRASISPEAVRFIDENFDKGEIYMPDKTMIKPGIFADKRYVIKQNNDTLGEIKSTLGSEAVFHPNKSLGSFGRISAIDLYVAIKVKEHEINKKGIDNGLLNVVSVLLKYDWDFANEKKPIFFWS